MIVFLLEVSEVRHDAKTYAKTYNFVIVSNWWGINKLALCYGVEKTRLVCDNVFIVHYSLSNIYCVQFIIMLINYN